MEIQKPSGTPGHKSFKKVYVVILLIVVFFLGVQFGAAGINGTKNLTQIFVDQDREGGPTEVSWQLLWDAIDQINQRYVDGPVDMTEILYGTISGAVNSLDDPYSVFLPPQKAQEFQDELSGNFEGIGAEIAIKNQRLVVVTPLDDSPAMKSGIQAGDFIYKVDGEETIAYTLEQAVNKIRGEAGSQVTLSVFHPGDTEATEIAITRDAIRVNSLSYEIKETNGKKIVYIKLRRFAEETPKEFEKAISQMLDQNISGVILDVRNNPGGFLETAVDISSYWVERGERVVIQRFGDGTEHIFEAKGNSLVSGKPTVVLINGGSASASEIVAGALSDHDLATLVGEKTFGKGSIQELLNLKGQAQLKLTVAKWLTPDGHDLNKEGLEPDEKVELTEEDFQSDRDPQLDRALEILAQ